MEITSYNLFNFVLRRYKKKEYKQKIKFKKDDEQNLTKEEKKISYKEIINYFNALIINNSNLSNIIFNSFNPLIEECFNNLEFLSMANNKIRNIDFIDNLPNLFFLDLFGNPIEDFTALNRNNIFGYLRLSVEFYNEKKIFNIHNLKCGILDLELKDKNKIKLFLQNNHHICMINKEVNLIINKIKYEENKMKLQAKRKTKIYEVSQLNSRSNNNIEFNNTEQKIINSPNNNKGKKDEEMEDKILVDNKKIKNPLLLKIKNYFDDYQSIMNEYLLADFRLNQNNIKNKRKSLLMSNEFFASQNYEKDKLYLQHEKDKLILIFEIYKKISIFNTEKKDNKYYVGNINYMNVNNHIDNIFVKEINDNIINHSQIPRSSIIILISILFYAIGVISEKTINILINHILVKYYNYGENKPFPDFSNFGDIHYLTFYYSTYDYIYKRMIDNEQNVSIEQYKKILKILLMEKLILKTNYLYQKFMNDKSKSNTSIFQENKKKKLANEIRSIKELNITKEFLVLIEFLCDYIIYEKIEELLIINSYPGEYSYLIELKATMEENEFNKEFLTNKDNKDNFLIGPTLSSLKYQKSKIERIYNKHYFRKYKINQDNEIHIMNKNKKSRTLNGFNRTIENKGLIKKKNYINNNEEKEYNKSDNIYIDECLYIDSIKRNRNNVLIRRKNISPFKLNYERKNFSFEYDNSCQTKTSSIYKNQNYEEFELLKKMIFNKAILWERARKVIKFEKQKRMFSRYNNLNIRKNRRKIKMKRFVHASASKNEESKPIGNNGFLSTNIENNNTSRNYFNLNSNNDTNIMNNNKMKLKSPNSTRYMINTFNTPNYYGSNKKNLKKIFNSTNNNHLITSKNIGLNDKSPLLSERKCSRPNHIYKSPFREIPESFPGITLLKFPIKNNKIEFRYIKLFNEKNTDKKVHKGNSIKVYTRNIVTRIKKNNKSNRPINMKKVISLNSKSNS